MLSWCCTEVPLLSISIILTHSPPSPLSPTPQVSKANFNFGPNAFLSRRHSRKLSTELSTPRLPNFRTSTVLLLSPFHFLRAFAHALTTTTSATTIYTLPSFLPPPPPPLPIFIAKLQAGLSSSSSSLCTHCWTAGSTKYTVWGFSPLEMRENGYRGVRWNGCKRGLFEKGCSSESMNNKRVFRSTSLQKNGGKSCWIESHKKWKIQNLKEFLREFCYRTL